MQRSAFMAYSPYEVGDIINIRLENGVGIVGGPAADTAEVVITDILAVHSIKRNQVTFMYEINGIKIIKLIKQEALNGGK